MDYWCFISHDDGLVYSSWEENDVILWWYQTYIVERDEDSSIPASEILLPKHREEVDDWMGVKGYIEHGILPMIGK